METSSISIQPINTTKVYMPQCDAFAPAASVAVNFEEIRLPAWPLTFDLHHVACPFMLRFAALYAISTPQPHATAQANAKSFAIEIACRPAEIKLKKKEVERADMPYSKPKTQPEILVAQFAFIIYIRRSPYEEASLVLVAHSSLSRPSIRIQGGLSIEIRMEEAFKCARWHLVLLPFRPTSCPLYGY